jgi:hypothetical protein
VTSPVIAVIDWRAAAKLKDNAAFLRRAGVLDELRPGRRAPSRPRRSLLVRADGSCALQGFTAGTVARRLLAGTAGTTTRKSGATGRG